VGALLILVAAIAAIGCEARDSARAVHRWMRESDRRQAQGSYDAARCLAARVATVVPAGQRIHVVDDVLYFQWVVDAAFRHGHVTSDPGPGVVTLTIEATPGLGCNGFSLRASPN
jgi:hypothetical protein